MPMQRPNIVVVGSLNVDHTLRVPHLPVPGETLTASSAFTCFGGKGANQAIAAARAGAQVVLIGATGKDDYGARYLEYLQQEAIDTRCLHASNIPTGAAFIAVDDRGENTIMVHPGANHDLLPAHIESHASIISAADVLLLQLECPLATVKQAAELARNAGVRVLVNPSPWSEAFVQAGIHADVLIVNETEVERLLSLDLEHALQQPEEVLMRARCQVLVVTRGARSTLTMSKEDGLLEVDVLPLTPIDTVGAGDSFAGALAVALGEGQSLVNAIRFANVAGALATQQAGAQAAIPKREQILARLA
jgi:ribokinase